MSSLELILLNPQDDCCIVCDAVYSGRCTDDPTNSAASIMMTSERPIIVVQAAEFSDQTSRRHNPEEALCTVTSVRYSDYHICFPSLYERGSESSVVL
jgi:hypothetical protein